MKEYLYDLSEGDGADQTLPTLAGYDDARNGEPNGEIGLVGQQDPDWGDQTGAPDDPQAGNIPGGKRDVLRMITSRHDVGGLGDNNISGVADHEKTASPQLL